MRARSLLFVAFGAIACSSIATKQNPRIPLIIPENGLIAINPPLTKRRIGTLSTRTTHSYFLSSLQAIFDEVGIGAILRNPYRGKTKGEMISTCVSKKALRYMHRSYSCGKGKRLNMQCGQCVPCLIRRAAFHAADVADKSDYYYDDLSMQGKADDVFSMRLATAKKYKRAEIERWAMASGPLPSNKDERKLHIEVVQRGILEVKRFLDTIKWH